MAYKQVEYLQNNVDLKLVSLLHRSLIVYLTCTQHATQPLHTWTKTTLMFRWCLWILVLPLTLSFPINWYRNWATSAWGAAHCALWFWISSAIDHRLRGRGILHHIRSPSTQACPRGVSSALSDTPYSHMTVLPFPIVKFADIKQRSSLQRRGTAPDTLVSTK